MKKIIYLFIFMIFISSVSASTFMNQACQKYIPDKNLGSTFSGYGCQGVNNEVILQDSINVCKSNEIEKAKEECEANIHDFDAKLICNSKGIWCNANIGAYIKPAQDYRSALVALEQADIPVPRDVFMVFMYRNYVNEQRINGIDIPYPKTINDVPNNFQLSEKEESFFEQLNDTRNVYEKVRDYIADLIRRIFK